MVTINSATAMVKRGETANHNSAESPIYKICMKLRQVRKCKMQ